MVAVGEETGELDDLMDEVAQMYEREVDYELKTLSAQIEPILIVMLGVLVLILALGVFLPIWDLGQVALKKGMMPMTMRGRLQRGFTLIELAVVAVIVGLLATALLNRIVFYQEQAEKTAMEQTLGTVRSALHLQISDLLVDGNMAGINRLVDQDPMSWLAENHQLRWRVLHAPTGHRRGRELVFRDAHQKSHLPRQQYRALAHRAGGVEQAAFQAAARLEYQRCQRTQKRCKFE